VLDRAVLAGGIDGLEHEQHGPTILRVQAILEIGQSLNPVPKRLLRARFVLGRQIVAARRPSI